MKYGDLIPKIELYNRNGELRAIKDFLNAIPAKEIRERALANREHKPSYSTEARCLLEAIDKAFTWDMTIEGDLFWHDLYTALSEKGSDINWDKWRDLVRDYI